MNFQLVTKLLSCAILTCCIMFVFTSVIQFLRLLLYPTH
nr:MAG TPA: hypothetical protein [Bacteriophage sp.]